MSKPTLCLDFDGVIHSYASGWQGMGVANDPPVPGTADWIEEASRYFEIAVYSSRSKSLRGRRCMKRYVRTLLSDRMAWDEENLEARLSDQIRYPWFKPSAFLTIDDRALSFNGDWAVQSPRELLRFKPWNRK